MNSIEEFCQKYGVERKNTDCVKWDGLEDEFGNEGLLPMWIADMEFKIPEVVQEAMIARIDHGVFGYTCVPDSYYQAFFEWQRQRYNVQLKKEWIRFSTGVVNSFFWMVNCFTQPGDSVIVLSPVYYPFYDAIRENKREVVVSNIQQEKGKYVIDFDDFENQIVAHDVKLFIHCSPHNPVGRVWTKEEMERLYDICLKHDVLIVADEIHQDLVRPDVQQIASLALDEKYMSHLIVLNAPSKPFNMACLLHSHIVIPNKEVRDLYDEYAGTVNNAAISVMGMIAAEAAYRHGSDWLKGLMDVVEYNYTLLQRIFEKGAPKIVMAEKEGTYLAWIDLSAYISPKEMKEFVQNKVGIAVDYGNWFGEGYETFIRINLGTLPKYIQEVGEKMVGEIQKIEACK